MKWIVYVCECDQQFSLPEFQNLDDATCPNCEGIKSVNATGETFEISLEASHEKELKE